MAKPTVTADSTQRKARLSEGNWDSRMASTEQGAQQNCGELSYLAGAQGSGQRDSMYQAPVSEWPDIERLRRHSVDSGSSTFTREDFDERTSR